MKFNLFGNPEKMLDDLRADWRVTIEGNGGHCPCCDRWGKINAQPMSEIMALGLLWISRAKQDENGWVNVAKLAPRWMLRGKSYATLAKWGLLESSGEVRDGKKSIGWWRVTPNGELFLDGKLSIPDKVYIYNNGIEGYSNRLLYFYDCFGKHFHYETVMSDNFNLNAINIRF